MNGCGHWLTMLALTSREYGFTFEQFLTAEPTYVNALYAAACENWGLRGVRTFLDMDIEANADEIRRTGKYEGFVVLKEFKRTN